MHACVMNSRQQESPDSRNCLKAPSLVPAQVTIRKLSSFEAIKALFGEKNIASTVDCAVWQRGGAHNIVVHRGFFGFGG